MNKKIFVLELIVISVFISGYIVPNIDLFGYNLPKLILLGDCLFSCIFFLKDLTKKDWLFIIIILAFTVWLKNFNFIVFIYLPIAEKIIEHRSDIIRIIDKSHITYFCLLATIAYSVYYFGEQGRYAFSSMHEINQSGLAIFLLGIILFKKNKMVGLTTLFYGLLTFSRSYYLAIIVTAIGYKIKNKFNEKVIKKANYLNITIISTVLLFVFGLLYINQYKLGNVTLSDNNMTRLFNLIDYSNFFRFSVIVILFYIFKQSPLLLITGMENKQFLNYAYSHANKLSIPYVGNIPHNLFLSHLKSYGIITLFETIYINDILKKIVDKNNFSIYISIIFYSVFLGSGLFNYWLFLSIFALLLYREREENEKN